MNNFDELKKYYLDHKGVRCPFCHSDDIESSRIGADGDTAKAFVSCNKCGKHWTDVYQLIDIEFPDERGDETTWKKPLHHYEKKYNELKKNKSLSEKQIAKILIKDEKEKKE